tara:strand:- start:603 stop:1496 length:894 start_codon:yes stop_codon:yes gene_type:complete
MAKNPKKDPKRKAIWKGWILDKGERVRVRAPHAMTRAEWNDYKDRMPRSEIDSFKDRQRLRTLPEWLTWRAIYPHQSEKVIDATTRSNVAATKKNPHDTQNRKRQISKCQSGPEGIAPSRRKHIPMGAVRVAIFPDTSRGKTAAQNYARKIIEEDYWGERNEQAVVTTDHENRSVQVVRTYCRDFDPKGWYYAVWVGWSQNRTLQRGRDDEGVSYQYRSGLRGESKRHNTGMTAKIRSVECPVCGAPAGENCAKKPRTYAEAISLIEAGEFTKRQILGNPHAARRTKYKEESENENV